MRIICVNSLTRSVIDEACEYFSNPRQTVQNDPYAFLSVLKSVSNESSYRVFQIVNDYIHTQNHYRNHVHTTEKEITSQID